MGRLSGFLSRHDSTMGRSASSMPSRSGGALTTRCTTAGTVSEPKGARPVEENAITHPHAKMSHLSVIPRPSICSGAM